MPQAALPPAGTATALCRVRVPVPFALSAAKGSLYLRTDGSSASTRAYVNTDGATTWTNLTSAA
jgi:hypothetical protein